ncbi:hypothetical protein BTVI_86392 [Pitangus sulphuratus]|nr:hypothetical protein BTVI_86392 [Pitangus sulphuratus]
MSEPCRASIAWEKGQWQQRNPNNSHETQLKTPPNGACVSVGGLDLTECPEPGEEEDSGRSCSTSSVSQHHPVLEGTVPRAHTGSGSSGLGEAEGSEDTLVQKKEARMSPE